MSVDWVNAPDNLEDYTGFVYCIKHIQTRKYYIGKKNFWFKKTLPPLKGRKNKRHSLVESDWKDYWGSSKKFQLYIKQEGEEVFERRILYLAENKFQLSYMELWYQMTLKVLFDPLAYNEIINVRLRKRK